MSRLYRAPRRLISGIVSATFLTALALTPVASAAPAFIGSHSQEPYGKIGATRFSSLTNSSAATTDRPTGQYRSSRMSVQVVLRPRNLTGLNSRLAAVYDTRSGEYHHWLLRGQFDSRYGPAQATRAAVARYLGQSGLTLQASASPFLVRAAGPSWRVAAAFRTTLSSYRDSRGIRYYANSSPVQLPRDLVHRVLGVVGLSNTVRMHSMISHAENIMRPAGKHSGSSSGCETGYVTSDQLFNLVNNGVGFPYGYGAGPGCSGLTPSQTNSIYDAPDGGQRNRGKGVNLAVFELSAYTQSDISTWANTFYGQHYTPPLVDINVDGGPLGPHTLCPAGDTCIWGYGGDVEVDADIQMQLTISPDAQNILVYNAPNDYSGQTELDEYGQIANDNTASVISSSWGLCENDAGAGFAQAENVIFEQMALQGQSMFESSGDSGAFDCITDGTGNAVNAEDPASQPWVTSVGARLWSRITRVPARARPTPPVSKLCGTWTISATQLQTREGSRVTSGAAQPAPAVEAPANSGAGRSTSGGPA